MDYVLQPSLERAALTRIAVALWDHDDVWVLTTMYQKSMLSQHESRELWIEARDKIIEKVPQLLLPETLKKKVLTFISGVGLEIWEWKERHNLKFPLDRVLPSDLYWTPHGIVDTKKMAEAIIQNENIDVTRRYKLACGCCLADDIPKLWNKIPENFRKKNGGCGEWGNLVAYWTYLMKGEVNEFLERIWERAARSPHQWAFEYAVRHGHKAATEYFLRRLNHKEREESLVTSAISVTTCSNSYFPDIFCFLFFQMDEREQTEVFKDHSLRVLRCLLKWPWQSVFMETANRMWDFVSGEDFHRLLSLIFREVIYLHRNRDYQKLFGEFWQQSPNAHKKYVIDALKKQRQPSLLLHLFEEEDIENIRLILNSATAEDRKDILCSPGGNYICERLVYTSKWDSLKLFLRAFLLSKEVMIEFKEQFMEDIGLKMYNWPAVYYKGLYDWNSCFELIDDVIQDNN